MSERHINDKRINTLYRSLATIRSNNYSYYGAQQAVSNGKIQFSFNNVGLDANQLKIRFTLTKKTIRFIVPTDPTADIQVLYAVKTSDPVKDIDQLYITEREDWLPLEEILNQVGEYFRWGVSPSDEFVCTVKPRVNKILPDTHQLMEDKLYFGVIKSVKSVRMGFDDPTDYSMFMFIELESGAAVGFEVGMSNVGMFQPKSVLLFNSEYRYRICSFEAAKEIVDFSPEDYRETRLLVNAGKTFLRRRAA